MPFFCILKGFSNKQKLFCYIHFKDITPWCNVWSTFNYLPNVVISKFHKQTWPRNCWKLTLTVCFFAYNMLPMLSCISWVSLFSYWRYALCGSLINGAKTLITATIKTTRAGQCTVVTAIMGSGRVCSLRWRNGSVKITIDVLSVTSFSWNIIFYVLCTGA